MHDVLVTFAFLLLFHNQVLAMLGYGWQFRNYVNLLLIKLLGDHESAP